ncbi:MAG: heme biosynthesis HemY N-terminal domain-containing protein [Pseudomonadota bacterium]
MYKRLLYFFLFLTFIAVLLVVAYGDTTSASFDIMGYRFETSIYLIIAALCVFLYGISLALSIFRSVRNLFFAFIGFFTGRNKAKAEKALLDAYAYMLAGRPETAKKHLKRAEKYFKGSIHLAFVKLMTGRATGEAYCASEELAIIEKDQDAQPMAAYAKLAYEDDHTTERAIELAEGAGSYLENKQDFIAHIGSLVKHKQFDKAENICVKHAKKLIGDQSNVYQSYCQLLAAYDASQVQSPEASLSHAQKSLKSNKSSKLAFILSVQSYNALLRENKAVRLIHDAFREGAHFVAVKIFLDLRYDESDEALAKRIAELPREKEPSEASLALQAYHYAHARDFHSLSATLRSAEKYEQSCWKDVAQICLSVEKDIPLFDHAVLLFRQTLDSHAFDELVNEVASAPALFKDHLQDMLKIHEATSADGLSSAVKMFKSLLKHIPIGSDQTGRAGGYSRITQEDVQKLYHGAFRDEDH